MEETKNDNLTALQRAKQSNYQKIKHTPEYIESKKKLVKNIMIK